MAGKSFLGARATFALSATPATQLRHPGRPFQLYQRRRDGMGLHVSQIFLREF
jgi:hypothetical protein